MPVCPYCGKYHRKGHHRRHVRTCVYWDNPALEHLLKSKGLGAKDYKARQEMLKKERLKKLGLV